MQLLHAKFVPMIALLASTTALVYHVIQQMTLGSWKMDIVYPFQGITKVMLKQLFLAHKKDALTVLLPNALNVSQVTTREVIIAM